MRNGKYELIIPPIDYPGKRYRGRYAYEHHVVFWSANGRLLAPDCVVHHKNDQKRENVPDNLEEKLRGDHTRDHNLAHGRTVKALNCGWCKQDFFRECRQLKPMQVNFYCCRSHQVKAQQTAIKAAKIVLSDSSSR